MSIDTGAGLSSVCTGMDVYIEHGGYQSPNHTARCCMYCVAYSAGCWGNTSATAVYILRSEGTADDILSNHIYELLLRVRSTRTSTGVEDRAYHLIR